MKSLSSLFKTLTGNWPGALHTCNVTATLRRLIGGKAPGTGPRRL